MSYFVRSGSLLGFTELVRELGENPGQMLQDVGLNAVVLQDVDLYFPYRSLAELLELAAARTGAIDFGVRLAARQGLEITGALGVAVGLQPDLESALRMLRDNVAFHARGANLAVEQSDDGVDVYLDFDFIDDMSYPQLQSLSVGVLCRAISQLHNEDLWPLEAVACIEPQFLTPRHSLVMQTPVHADVGRNRIRYSADMLQLPVSISGTLLEHVDAHWKQDALHARPLRLSQQVERAITALLPTGGCDLEAVSHVVGLHPRILQRKLQGTDTSFKVLLANVRLRLACHFLKNSDIDVTGLATNLGFADVAAFSRVFKKWTSYSPSEWRKRAGGQSL